MRATRRNALLTGAAQAIGGGLLWYLRPNASGIARLTTSVVAGVLWTLAATFVLSALLAPAIAGRLHAVWTRAARAIGVVFTFVMFTVLFAVLLPFFLFVRLKDPLRKRLGAASYWERRTQEDDSLERAMRPY
jgi:O-antigen ligase